MPGFDDHESHFEIRISSRRRIAMIRNKRCSHKRRGYTLIEMLLVQGVIVSLVAMSWPALRGSLDKNRLLAAARQVRTELVQARLKAAETGLAQQFRYSLGDRRYEVAPAQPAPGQAASALAGRAAEHSGSNPVQLDEEYGEDTSLRLAMLDEEISFADPKCDKDRDDRDAEPAPAAQGDDALDVGSNENWSAPVVFLPNGRSSNARVRLAGARGFHVDVLLRGLTGSVTVGELTRDEESE
jgi:Tfp pilus assembly protein FimT